MNGAQFIKRIKRLGRQNGIAVRLDAEHGKGSHGRLYYGSAFTTVKDRKKEIGRSLLAAMCRQLGVRPTDI